MKNYSTEEFLEESIVVDKLEKEMRKIKDWRKLAKWFKDNINGGKATKDFEILDYMRMAARYRNYNKELFDEKYTMWT
jgi:hypothetical protein